MANSGTGTKATSTDILQVLLTVRDSTMKATNVADVFQIESEDNGQYTCKSINEDKYISCIALDSLQLNVSDVVLVLFTDTDYRSNLTRIKSGKNPQSIDIGTRHTRDCGVIIGIIYKENSNDNA